ncbi:CHAT domain-containing protein [Bacillus sp. AFS037270]|uniref:CHAT domain-containing protein n=1 Tax=Bacillus sp. AFS037270 TaxID=2033499 RepID=UPI000BFBBFC3|nr:CHAT domain-containing protein [Bacillus sp. AFS037270]PGV54173.1 hypothetical protein COD92_05940 [Bacillus sp. AFS037270]
MINKHIFQEIDYHIKSLQNIFIAFKPILGELSTQGIDTCECLKQKLNVQDLIKLRNLVFSLRSIYSPSDIRTHKAIVNEITNLLIFSAIYLKLDQNISDHFRLLVVEDYLTFSLHLSQQGLPGESYNYQNFAINSSPFNPSDKQIEWDFSFWQRIINRKDIEGQREVLIMLVGHFFYLSRILGHNYRESHELYKETNKWLKTGKEAKLEDIYYLAFYAGVLASNYNEDHSNWVHKQLLEQYQIQIDLKNEVLAFIIAETFTTTFGKIIEEDITLWAKRALSLDVEMPEESRVALKLCKMKGEHKFDKEGLETLLRTYLEHLNSSLSILENCNIRNRRSDILITIIMLAIKHEEYSFAVKSAVLWRTFFNPDDVDEQLFDDVIILLIPTLKDAKSIYLIMEDGNTTYHEFDDSLSLKEFLKIKNSFEGTWTVIAGDTEPINKVEYDTPNDEYSSMYDMAIEKYFNPREIANLLKGVSKEKKIRLLELTWTNTPIIPKISWYLQRNISLLGNSKNLKEAKLKKVLIWCDPDNSLTDAYNEKEALEVLLNYYGISYEVYVGSECSLQLFLSKYNDLDFDLIWLMCHGAFNFDNPNDSVLTISETETVRLSQLVFNNQHRKEKRLLVLNACQSGCSTIRYDGMGFVGLGSSLSSRNQTVFGHLWSVHSFAASILGPLFLTHILNGSSWGEALNLSRIDMSKGKEAILKSLRISIWDKIQLMDSIEYRNINLKELIYWASPILFE